MTKVQILEEIQRTAAANGGVPLGSRKFFSETGIKEPDWKGRYWARWSDAVREAGFIPNELTSAYEDEVLLTKFADLALELGRIPATAEIRLKIRSDPSFPNDRTFERFGSKAELVERLTEFCGGRSGYEDVLRLCGAYEPRAREVPAAETSASEPAIGYVYLIKSGRFHKIGRSNAAGRREYEIALQLPEKTKTVHVIRTDDPVGIEEYWHKRFHSKRKNGEWFDLTADDTAAFRRRKFM